MSKLQKTLFRLPNKAKIAGVCAGIADYIEFDVSVIRFLFIVTLFFTGGTILFLYIILAIVLPVDYASKTDTVSKKAQQLGKDISDNGTIERVRNYTGLGLLLFGLWMLVQQFWPEIFNLQKYFIPVLLIVVGILILYNKKR